VTPDGEPQPIAEAAVVLPPPEGPAGLDPAEADARPLAGRRARLRRRLRYLRRARELMLRDLGGLVFEIHRTGGGDMTAHAPIVEGKVERLRHLDQESIALERALGAPRGETVVFQPGIGGTCLVCGELYASSARFCSACGTSTEAPAATFEPAGSPVVAAPEVVEPHGSLGFARPAPATTAFTPGDPLAARPAAAVEPETEAPAPAAEEQPTTVLEPAGDEPAADRAEREPEPATEPEPPAAEPHPQSAGEPGPAPIEPERNGTVAPTLQPGDPLIPRDRP
jgi:hypothetical protein